MKILLDPQIFAIQRYGGISRYYTEVFSRLSNSNEIIIPTYSVQNVYFNNSKLFGLSQNIYFFYLRILLKLRIRRLEKTNKRNSNYIKKKASKQQFDIFVPTYYDPYFIDYIGSKPFVLTVYDMIHELFPEYFLDDKMLVPNKKLLIEKATRIIAVSENTKKDIIKIYPHIECSKIDVIYHGCSIKVNNIKPKKFPEKYILFVGKRAIYKNFNFLVYSIAELLINDENLFLVCAGGGDFSQSEKEMISNLGLENKILQKHFNEDELGCFYNKALCFVFPSMYEGFGIPVLESMACGCPVVLGKHSSFIEVAGDAGFYFDLNSKEDLKNKIETLIQNKTLRNDISLKGFEQVKKFSWEKAATECLSVYKRASNVNDFKND